jgi:hypothetical protein
MDLDIRGVSWDCLSAVFQSIMSLCVATLYFLSGRGSIISRRWHIHCMSSCLHAVAVSEKRLCVPSLCHFIEGITGFSIEGSQLERWQCPANFIVTRGVTAEVPKKRSTGGQSNYRCAKT